MSEANFQVALREAERAAKKQKTCAGQCATAVGALQLHLQVVRQQVGRCALAACGFQPWLWLQSHVARVLGRQVSAAQPQTCTENSHALRQADAEAYVVPAAACVIV